MNCPAGIEEEVIINELRLAAGRGNSSPRRGATDFTRLRRALKVVQLLTEKILTIYAETLAKNT